MKIFAIIGTNTIYYLIAIAFLLFIIGLFLTIAVNFVKAIALYIFAYRMGNKFALYAFFPYVHEYLEYTIPQDEFKLFNVIKIKNRKVASIIVLVLYHVILKHIHVPFPPVNYLLHAVFSVIRIKRYYDMYVLVEKKNAVAFAILSELFPVFHAVILCVYCRMLRKRGQYGK